MGFWGFSTIALLVFWTTSARCECGSAERATPLFRAFEACDRSRLANTADAMSAALAEMQALGFCRIENDASAPSTADAKACADPAGFVCANGGNVMDSDCNFSNFDSATVPNTPAFVESKCAVEASLAKDGNTEPRSALEREQFYFGAGGSRLAKLKLAYTNVMKQFREAFKNRPDILDKLNHTKLALEDMIKDPPDPAAKDRFLHDTKGSDCYNLPPAGPPNTQIFNDPNVDSNGNRLIHICIGGIANLDRMNPYTLMESLGHEIAHSIDPCSLENDAWEQHPKDNLPKTDPKRGSPNIANEQFPGLLPCLRGGTGPTGCGGSPAISCPTKADTFAPCMTAPAKDKAICTAFAQGAPDCALSNINESFADFMGAEMAGRKMKENDAGPIPMSANEKRDALIASAAQFAHLHGGCGKTEVNGHPPARVRMNRMVMSSDAFRQGVGCPTLPKEMPGQKTSCKAF